MKKEEKYKDKGAQEAQQEVHTVIFLFCFVCRSRDRLFLSHIGLFVSMPLERAGRVQGEPGRHLTLYQVIT